MPIRGNCAWLLTVVGLLLGAAAPIGLGKRLFVGLAPLHGRLYTQSDDLPSEAARCMNCHAYRNSAPIPYSNAPRLSAQWLLGNRQRHGGPKSHYDRQRFCSLLRTGVDPSYIVINVEMPRYELTDEECSSLWTFLTEPADAA
jgi:hypothetical protein